MLRGKEFLELREQGREFLSDGLPDDVFVDVEIVVHDLASHADDRVPGNVWVRLSKGRRYTPGRFPDDLDQVSQSETQG